MKTLLGFLLCISVMSCTNTYNKNNYLPSTKRVATTWDTKDNYYRNTQANLPYLTWWEKFHDPTLNQLMKVGLVQNNQINIAMANVEASQGELKRVKLNWIPTVGSNVGYSSFPTLGFPGVLLGLAPTYTLNVFSQLKEEKKAGYELKASKAAYDAVKLAVIGQIASSYFSYSAQVEQLRLLKKLDHHLTELVNISSDVYKGGLTSESAWENQKHELKLIKAQEMLTQHNITVSRNALCYLLNLNPQNIPLTHRFSQLNGNQIVVGSMPLTVIENRPDMIEAANALKASNEGVGLAFSNLLPNIQLSTIQGLNATTDNGYKLGDRTNFNQALLQTPIIQASVLGQVDTAKGLNKASYYRYLDTLRKVMRDVNNDMSAHDLYTARLAQITDARNDEKIIYDLHTELYHRGINSYMQLLQAAVKLDYLNIEVNQSQWEQFITIVNLYQDLAGGYKNKQPRA